MLIIFDLDDTLLDTSGVVTPFKMSECLKRMIADGAKIENFDAAYGELLALNQKCMSSKDTIFLFAAKVGGDPERAVKELIAPLPENFQIPMTPGAKEILNYLIPITNLSLVTGGYPPFQAEKMKKAGLDPSIFSKIAIPEDSVKKPFYMECIKEFFLNPNEIWVCGDRIEMDLVPAYELGLKTIHMRWGRGKVTKSPEWVDRSIETLRDLKGIIK